MNYGVIHFTVIFYIIILFKCGLTENNRMKIHQRITIQKPIIISQQCESEICHKNKQQSSITRYISSKILVPGPTQNIVIF